MIDHATLKIIHISCVILSISGFVTRGSLMLADSDLLQQRVTRILPHFIDTALLVSGIWLAYKIQQYPGDTPWLTAKLVALLIYIVLGSFALRGRSRKIRIVALMGSLLTLAYLVSVALTRTPLLLASVQ